MQKLLQRVSVLAALAPMLMMVHGNVYGQSTNQNEVKENQISAVEHVEAVIDSVFEKAEGIVSDEELENQMTKKKKEIEALLEDTKEQIQQATSPQVMKEIVEDSTVRAVAKTYAGLTEYESVEENVTVDGTKKEKKQAIKTAVDSLSQGDEVKLIIKTSLSQIEVYERMKLFDPSITITFMYVDEVNRYGETQEEYVYQIIIDKKSVLAHELLENIEDGDVPQHVLGIMVIQPDVLRLDSTANIEGEEVSDLRGLERYKAGNYQSFFHTLKKVKVGVVDTGVDPFHPDLISVISSTMAGYDFVNHDTDPSDDHYHGTHVAGTIGAAANGKGIFGVNSNVEIVPLKICNAQGLCPTYAIYDAVTYAADHGIEVLNMSLGGRASHINHPVCEAIDYATSRGVVVVAAAGNANDNATLFVPGACENTITVGAVDQALKRASFSNYGGKVDISAPGVGIRSTVPGGGYKTLNGTSMATPHVAGLVASILAVTEGQTVASLKNLLQMYSVPTTYEEGKYIGPFADMGMLMNGLGVLDSDFKTQNGSGDALAESGSHQDEIERLQQLSGVADPLSVDTEGFTIMVSKSKKIYVEGGVPPYTIKSSGISVTFGYMEKELTDEYLDLQSVEDVEFPHESNEQDLYHLITSGNGIATEREYSDEEGEDIGTASAGTGFYFKVFGLIPGETNVIIRDSNYTELTIPVKVVENNIVVSVANTSKQAGIKISGPFKATTAAIGDGVSLTSTFLKGVHYPVAHQPLSQRISFGLFNKHVKKDIAMVMRVSTEGYGVTPLEILPLDAPLRLFEKRTVSFSGGKPPYYITSYSPNIVTVSGIENENQGISTSSTQGALITNTTEFAIQGSEPGYGTIIVNDADGQILALETEILEEVYQELPESFQSLEPESPEPAIGPSTSLVGQQPYDQLYVDVPYVELEVGQSQNITINGGNENLGYLVFDRNDTAIQDVFGVSASNSEDIVISEVVNGEAGVLIANAGGDGATFTVTAKKPGKAYVNVRDKSDGSYQQGLNIPVIVKEKGINLSNIIRIDAYKKYKIPRENSKYTIADISTHSPNVSIDLDFTPTTNPDGTIYNKGYRTIYGGMNNRDADLVVSIVVKGTSGYKTKKIKLLIGGMQIDEREPAENYTGSFFVSRSVINQQLGDKDEIKIRGGTPPYSIRSYCTYVLFNNFNQIGVSDLGTESENINESEKSMQEENERYNDVAAGSNDGVENQAWEWKLEESDLVQVANTVTPSASFRLTAYKYNATPCNIEVRDAGGRKQIIPVTVYGDTITTQHAIPYVIHPAKVLGSPVRADSTSAKNDWTISNNYYITSKKQTSGLFKWNVSGINKSSNFTTQYIYSRYTSQGTAHLNTPVYLDIMEFIEGGIQPETNTLSFQSNLPFMEIQAGDIARVQVSGGKPPYTYTKNGEFVAFISNPTQGSDLTAFVDIIGVKRGNASVTITDAAGTQTTVSVSVTYDGTPKQLPLNEVRIFTATDPFIISNLTASNTGVVTIEPSPLSGQWSVHTVTEGAFTLYAMLYDVRDGSSIEFEQAYVVMANPTEGISSGGLLESHQGITMSVGDLQTVWVSGGIPPYRVDLGANGIVGFTKHSQNGQNVSVSSIQEGDVVIMHSSKAEQNIVYSNVVSEGGMVATENDIAIATVEERAIEKLGLFDKDEELIINALPESRYFRLFGAKPGTTRVNIFDSENKRGSIGIDVKETFFTVHNNAHTEIGGGDWYTITAVASLNSNMLKVSHQGGGTYRLTPQVFHGEVGLKITVRDIDTGAESILHFTVIITDDPSDETPIDEGGESEDPGNAPPVNTTPLKVEKKEIFNEVGKVITIEIRGGLPGENGYEIIIDGEDAENLIPLTEGNIQLQSTYKKPFANVRYQGSSEKLVLFSDESYGIQSQTDIGQVIKLIPLKPGNYTVTVKDRLGTYKEIPIESFTGSVQMFPNTSTTHQFHSGLEIKGIASDDSSIFSIIQTVNKNEYIFESHSIGWTYAHFNVRNPITSKDRELDLAIHVTKAIVNNTEVTSEVENGYLGGIRYSVVGDYERTGVEITYAMDPYTALGGQKEEFEFGVDNSNTYAGFLFPEYPQCENGCVFYVRPYIYSNGKKTTSSSWQKVNYKAKGIYISEEAEIQSDIKQQSSWKISAQGELLSLEQQTDQVHVDWYTDTGPGVRNASELLFFDWIDENQLYDASIMQGSISDPYENISYLDLHAWIFEALYNSMDHAQLREGAEYLLCLNNEIAFDFLLNSDSDSLLALNPYSLSIGNSFRCALDNPRGALQVGGSSFALIEFGGLSVSEIILEELVMYGASRAGLVTYLSKAISGLSITSKVAFAAFKGQVIYGINLFFGKGYAGKSVDILKRFSIAYGDKYLTNSSRILWEGTKASEVQLKKDNLIHILERHRWDSKALNAGKFNNSIDVESLEELIRQGLESGLVMENSGGRSGFIILYDAGYSIGKHVDGSLTSKIKIVVKDNMVITAFPYPF